MYLRYVSPLWAPLWEPPGLVPGVGGRGADFVGALP